MKFVCLSDVHLSSENPVGRLDNIVETQFRKLEYVFEFANSKGADILQAGDLFTKPRSWLLLPMIIELFKKYPEMKFFSVRGQHDDYMYSEETKERTNLGILTKFGLVAALSDKPETRQDVSIYGANFGQNLPDIKRSEYNIGVIHCNISDTALWKDHKFTAAGKFLADHPGYDFILVGDIHKKFEVETNGRRLINCGPMLRREATEYNFQHKPCFYVLDTEGEGQWIEIPHEPAKVVLERDRIERKAETENLLDEFVNAVQEKIDGNTGVSFVENLLGFAKENSLEKGVIDILAKYIERTRREGL